MNPVSNLTSAIRAADRLLTSRIPAVANELDAASAALRAGRSVDLGRLRSADLPALETDLRTAANEYLSNFERLPPGQKPPNGADGVNRTMNVFAEPGRQQPIAAIQLALLHLNEPTGADELAHAVTLLKRGEPRITEVRALLTERLATISN